MQNSPEANRIKTAAHARSGARLANVANQVVVDDWRLRNWISDGAAPGWVAPTTAYNIVTSASGDYIRKNTTVWDLGYQDLGVNVPVTMPDGVTTSTPYVSSQAMTWTNTGARDLVCFYAKNFRNGWDSGIYVVQCVDDGAGHLFWSQPTPVYESVTVADFNNQSQLFVTFPRLLVINGEFWITALECSLEVTTITYHLCYFRSADGEHWSRKEYLVGVSNDAAEIADATAGTSINQYNNGTLFTLNDIIHGYITVTGSKVFLSGKPVGRFSCPATSLVGVTNNAMTLDVSKETQSYSISRPTAPGSMQATTTIRNPGKKFDNNAILVPGARLIRKAGYQTSNGQELVTVGYEYIDAIEATKAITPTSYQDALKLTSGDSMIRMRDLSDDTVREYNSPKQSIFEQFCNLTAVPAINGGFYVGLDGTSTNLTCAALDPNAPTAETMGYIPVGLVEDGCMEFKFQFAGTFSNWLTAAVVFQGDKTQGERNFYSVAYWAVSTRWVLVRAIPTLSGRKIYTYDTNVFYNGTVQALSTNTWYWLKVQQYHNHIMAWTSSDHITWTNVIDYQIAVPSANPIPCNKAFWGILGGGRSTPSAPLGNTDGSGGKVAMDSGGSPKYFAVKFTTGATTGMFTTIAGLFTQTGQPGPLTLGIAKDNGSGTAPANINAYANVIYSISVPSINFSNSDQPVGKAFNVPGDLRSTANTIYWIFVTFQGSLSAGQSVEWYTGGSALTVSSTDGTTWATESGKSMCAAVIIDYDGVLAEFQKMYWTSGEKSHTLEDLAQHIAAKAHVLTITADSWAQNPDFVGGWVPATYGTLGDFVFDADVTGANGEVYFRATTQGNATTGYKLVLGASTLTLYRNNVLIYSISSMQTIPASYHLRIANQTKWVQVWINDALAGTFYDANLTVPGYFGVGVAQFANARIPDMRIVKPYHLTDEGESVLTSLSRLVDKTRFKFFMRFDNSLRIGSFPRRASVDTYTDTVTDTGDTQTDRYVINQIKPTSNNFAMAWLGKMLDKFGLRYFKKYDYTTAFSNEDALKDSAAVMRLAAEQGQAFSMTSRFPVFPMEVEDRITVSGQDYLVNDYSFEVEPGQARATQRTGLRNWTGV